MLTEEQMIEILKNKKINQCSKEERDQVMDFAFGSDFMESDSKGEKQIVSWFYQAHLSGAVLLCLITGVNENE